MHRTTKCKEAYYLIGLSTSRHVVFQVESTTHYSLANEFLVVPSFASLLSRLQVKSHNASSAGKRQIAASTTCCRIRGRKGFTEDGARCIRSTSSKLFDDTILVSQLQFVLDHDLLKNLVKETV